MAAPVYNADYRSGYHYDIKVSGVMRLPNEPLMSKNHYQAHAWKLVEQRRKELESSLNMTSQQQFFRGLSIALIVGIFVILVIYVSLNAALIGAGVGFVVLFMTSFFISGHPPEYGVWEVECHNCRFVRGDKINFTCKRLVDGKIVEEITRG